jgi:hypothetical protein
MDFDEEIVGWLSAVENLEDLWVWFSKEDIRKLQEYGWFIYEYQVKDYKFYGSIPDSSLLFFYNDFFEAKIRYK